LWEEEAFSLSNERHSDRRKKTITRTFRIRREWDDVLQEEANRQGVSVNVLLKRVLRRYSLFSRWSDRNNDMSLPQQTFREILKKIPVEVLAEAGTKSGASDAINIVNALGIGLCARVFLNPKEVTRPLFTFEHNVLQRRRPA
jgi:hypothetical protein